MSSQLAEQELEGHFIEIAGLMFQRSWFKKVDQAPRDAMRVRYWDKAATPDGGSYTAGVLLARCPRGMTYIEHAIRGQWSYHQRDIEIERTAESDHQKYNGEVVIIAEAIMSTDQMKWVSQQMQTGGSPAGGAQIGQSTGGPPDQFGTMGRYSAIDDDSANVDPVGESFIDSEQYAAIVEGQQQMADDLASAHSRIAELEVERTDATRASRLTELNSRLTIDLNAEKQRCLYSAGSTMTDDEFDRHYDTIEMYAATAIERVDSIPQGVVATQVGEGRESAQYAAKRSSLIRDLTNHYANQGQTKTYDQLRKEADERLASQAAA